ncbi:MAG: hypothetical protein K2Z81_24040, partial [Cyanobacteria bacterium]|nr:hypothetical protein [Cyanobacteriota bacterium]
MLASSLTAGIGTDSEGFNLRASMLGSLGRFVGPQEISALTKLSGRQGLQLLEANLRHQQTSRDLRFDTFDTETLSEDLTEKARDLQRTLGKTLLSIASSSLDERGRARAISALADKDWSINIRADKNFREALSTFIQKHRDNPTVLASVSRLVVDGKSSSPAARFRSMGVEMSDYTLSALTDRAVTRYGADKVEQVINRIALFNALPPDARAKLTGSSDTIAEGETLELKGKTLDARTYASLPLNIRKEINGDAGIKPDEKLVVARKVNITGAEFNLLPTESRRLISGSDRRLAESDVVSLPGSIDAKTFNALPESLRMEISGSKKPLRESVTLSLTDKIISNRDLNLLPGSLRAKITGSTKQESPPEGFITLDRLKGRVLDAKDVNQMHASLRKSLTGKEVPLFEGERVTDISRFSIDATKFNQLSSDVKRYITGHSQLLERGQKLNLAGSSFDSQTFNALSDNLRKQLNGGKAIVLEPGQKFKPKSANALLDAEKFNQLSVTDRRILTGVDKVEPNRNVSLRGVELSAELFNKLPEDLRTAITGSSDELSRDRVVRDLSPVTIDGITFNKLAPEHRQRLRERDT